jgi:hypothetical protein
LPAVVSPPQVKPSAARRGLWGFLPDYDKTIRQCGGGDEFNTRFIGECASARAGWQALRCPLLRAVCESSRAQRKAGVWARQPPPATKKHEGRLYSSTLISNLGVHTNENSLFDNAEHSTGRAPASDAAGQAPKYQCDAAARSLGAADAMRCTLVFF